MQQQTVIFIGPQGSGKGTQVRNLKSYLEGHDPDKRPIVDLQTGKPLRELGERGGYTNERVKVLLEEGKMVPFFLITSMIVQELMHQVTEDCHLIFDGYPRDLQQAERFEDILEFYDRPSLAVVHLDTSEDVVIERMLARGRSDDTEAAIKERLHLYHELTEPLLEYYQARPDTNYVKVNGAATIQTVQADIRAGLGI